MITKQERKIKMSKKTELIKVFKDYKGKYEIIQGEVQKVNQNTELTLEGRENAISRLLEHFNSVVTSHHDRAVDIIDKGVVALTETWKKNTTGKLADSGYQSGLSNVIKMLELGTIQSTEDLQNIVNTYKDDFNAVATIESMVRTKGILGVTFPTDNREKNRQLLNQLRGNVDLYINNERLKSISRTWNTFNQGTTDISVSMDSMAEFVDTRLGDNLELLS